MVISKERLEASRRAREAVVNKYAKDTQQVVEKLLKEEGHKRAEAARKIIETKGPQVKRNAKMAIAKGNAARIKKTKALKAAEKAEKILIKKAKKAAGNAKKTLEKKAERKRKEAERIRKREAAKRAKKAKEIVEKAKKKEKPKFFDEVRPTPVPTIPDEPRDNRGNAVLNDEVTRSEEDLFRTELNEKEALINILADNNIYLNNEDTRVLREALYNASQEQLEKIKKKMPSSDWKDWYKILRAYNAADQEDIETFLDEIAEILGVELSYF